MVGDLNIGPASYSGWGPNSYHQNLDGLGLKDTFKKLLKYNNQSDFFCLYYNTGMRYEN
jgi:hypothetical protein